MARVKTRIDVRLSEAEREELGRRARGQLVPHRDVIRAKMILRLAEGAPIGRVALETGKQRRIVRKWAERFVKKRLLGLQDKEGRGRPPRFSPRSRDSCGQARVRAA